MAHPPSTPERQALRRLWRIARPGQLGRLGVLALASLLMAAATALYPVIIGRAFRMFAARDAAILWQVPVAVLVIVLVKGVAWYGQSVLTQSIALRAVERLQSLMFGHLVRADLAQVERAAPAELAARITADSFMLREALGRAMNAYGDVLTIAGLVITMVRLDWQLSLGALVIYPLAIAPLEKLGRRIRKASNNLQEVTAATAGRITEIFAQMRVVQTHRLEAQMTARAEATFTGLYEAQFRVVRRRNRAEPLMEVLGGVAVAGIITFAGWRAAIGGQDIGNFTGFVSALLLAAGPARSLGTLKAVMEQGRAALARIYALLDEPARIVAGPRPLARGAAGALVEFRHVGLVYADGRAGLRDLSFTARPGQMVGIVGASGSGKTTALSLIPRFYEASSGAVLINGQDVRELTLESLRDAIAWVGQESILFDESLAANVARGRPDAPAQDIEAALRDAAALDFVQAMPQGADSRAGTSGRLLSGGQRQRVALARAILKDAPILLLDEATSALDAESEAIIHGVLLAQKRRRTILMTAHRLATVRAADLIVVMQDGVAVESGTHAELLVRQGSYARLVAAQG